MCNGKLPRALLVIVGLGVLSAVCISGQTAQAAPLYFSGSGTVSSWDYTSTNWSAFMGGLGTYSDSTWLDSSDAVFEGTAGTVNVNGNSGDGVIGNVNSLTFSVNNYYLSGGTINLTGTGGSISTNGTGLTTIGSVLGGSVGLTKYGPGTLLLASPNIYSGGTNVSAGVLQLGNANALGTGALAVNSGTLNLGGFSVIVPSFSGAAGTIINSNTSPATLTVNQPGVTTFSGTIADGTQQTGLSLTGSGELVLNGVTTYSGTTTLNNSVATGYHPTLALYGSLPNSPVAIQSGVLVLAGTVGQNVTMSGGGIDDWPLAPVNNLIVGSLTVTGGTANWYSGVTTVAGGAVVQGGSFVIGPGAKLATPTLTVSGGALQVATGGTLSGNLNYTSPVGSTLAGQIAGAGNTLTLNNGSTTLTLNGPNTYTGGTTITAGTLALGGAGVLGGGNYAATIANSGAFVVNTSANQTFGGAITGTGSLVKSAGGTLLVGNAGNSYSGGTTIVAASCRSAEPWRPPRWAAARSP